MSKKPIWKKSKAQAVPSRKKTFCEPTSLILCCQKTLAAGGHQRERFVAPRLFLKTFCVQRARSCHFLSVKALVSTPRKKVFNEYKSESKSHSSNIDVSDAEKRVDFWLVRRKKKSCVKENTNKRVTMEGFCFRV